MSIKSLDHVSSALSMYPVSGGSDVLVAGQSHSLSLISVHRGTLLKQMDIEGDVVVMKQSRLVCCGTTTGRVMLKDPRSFNTEHVIEAHTGTISDMDVVGNTIVTCGFSQRAGQMVIDPLVKIYDMRTLKTLPPVSFPGGPALLKFHPKLTSTIYTASQSGQFQVCDLGNPSQNVEFYQVDLSGYLTALDISSSGEVLSFGDSTGVVHLWTEKNDAKINPYSRSSELPSPAAPVPNIRVTDDSPLSLIGMPYYNSPLLSGSWANLTFEVGRAPPRIPPEVLPNMKMIQFVGYAPNPGNFKRNQQLVHSHRSRKNSHFAPKFRSEQEREKYFGKNGQLTSQEDVASAYASSTSTNKNGVPRSHRRVEIKYSRFGVEDFDFGFYNKTLHAGLETHIHNSYCNSMLQSLFFCGRAALRDLLVAHVRSDSCSKESCLSCELAWLFCMLVDAKGSNCQASNFLKAFSSVPEGNALELFEPDPPNPMTSYSSLIQKFTRFILEQMHQDLTTEAASQPAETGAPSSVKTVTPFQSLMGMKIESTSRCSQCQDEVVRDLSPFVVDLAYLRKGQTNKIASTKVETNSSQPSSGLGVVTSAPGSGSHASSTFSEVLSQSLSRETTTKAWCATCKRYTFIAQSKRLLDLPTVVTLNADATTEEVSDFWRADSNGKPWLPLRIGISVEDGLTTVVEGDTLQELETRGYDPSKFAVFDLSSVVFEVLHDSDPPHLVAHVNVQEEDGMQWYLFNDFLVQPVQISEVARFARWKVPAVIQFTRVDLETVFPSIQTPKHGDPSILFGQNMVLNRRSDFVTRYETLIPEEIIGQTGYLCAIDAEFIALTKEETEIRSDGTRQLVRPSRLSLARVSVVRGEGEKDGLPFIDDYIYNTEPIVDYLTEFSGIKPGDLDPVTSTFPLVRLKSAYRKLRALVDMGCIFVGHGLKKDFRTISKCSHILVPPEQVIDTVDIYFLKSRQRKLSLRFLAWRVLNQDIQTVSHDSIEDARTALALYKRYLELSEAGTFQSVLEEIYEDGRAYNYRPPQAQNLRLNNGVQSQGYSTPVYIGGVPSSVAESRTTSPGPSPPGPSPPR
ncbi:ubiquitin carboxyl-terminal hydrolase-domain-containing protein [Cladochytrium replicatum]|nr:ubiquitin carboxyl-terminal hydrolase-domain-containing protein [Cladochytrium replicatum]